MLSGSTGAFSSSSVCFQTLLRQHLREAELFLAAAGSLTLGTEILNGNEVQASRVEVHWKKFEWDWPGLG